MSTAHMKYRADIDGLRAIAVLSVTLFHINPQWLPNGYLGVDMFFVLSGYLITSTLRDNILGGTFSFAEFYRRRIKRILPVFFLVLFTGLILSWFLMIPDNRIALEGSARGAILFLSNIQFAQQGGYFDVSSEEKPFLHIWSLSIEEQFYFIFPIVLIFLFRYKYTRERIRWILLGGCLILLSSSFLNKFAFSWDPYYLPHTRFGELLVGSILAVGVAGEKRKLWENNLGKWIGSIAGLVLLLSFFAFPSSFKDPLFPGLLALVPCVATALLIWANDRSYWLSRLLSLKPIVWVGKISYSLYLWHWLILAFIRYFWGSTPLSMPIVVGAVLLMFAFSVSSFYLVEQPIRKNKYSFKKNFLYYYLIPSSLVYVWVYTPKSQDTLDDKYKYYSKETICFDTVAGDCRKGDLSQPTRVLIAGDSHTGHLGKFVDKVGKTEGWCAFLSSAASCPFFFDYDFKFRGQKDGFCSERNVFLSEEYKKFPIIILSNYWGSKYYKEDPTFIPHLEKTLQTLLSAGKRVYLINSTYVVATTRLRESYIKNRYGINLNLYPLGLSLRTDEYEAYRENAMEIKRLVSHKYPQVRWVDLVDYIPESLQVDGMPIMGDVNHLNDYGAEFVADEFLKDRNLIVEEDRALLK